ncbi:hypothetical protein C8R47DRAFT_925837, partial [Mycena vitilis]
WMRRAEDIERDGQEVSSVVIALQNEEDALALVGRRLPAFARFCDVKKHTDKPPFLRCTKCWGMGHITTQCKKEVACRGCAGNHDERDHPADEFTMDMEMETEPRREQIKCAQCEGNHVANDRRCPT